MSALTELTTLKCNNNQLTELDVDNNTKLKTLYCNNNQLTTLNVDNNTALKTLYCNNNQLKALDVSNNTNLATLYCHSNQLEELDVADLTALTTLQCQSNQIAELDVADLTKLTTLRCYSNQITELDVADLTALTDLRCYSNKLTTLNVDNNTALKTLYCHSNQLEELDVADLTALTDLRCYSNKLTTLNVDNNTALTTPQCQYNQLEELVVSNNTNLATLYCHSNQLEELDVSNNTNLATLYCYDNQVAALDVSNNTALTTLRCQNNQLEELDVSNNTALTTLHCQNNQLEELVVSSNTALTSLQTYNNNIRVLDLKANTKLTNILFNCMPLETLVLPGTDWDKSQVTYINYRNTPIKTLDLSGFTGLTKLAVTACTNLEATGLQSLIGMGQWEIDDPFAVRIHNAEQITQDRASGFMVVQGNVSTIYGYSIPDEAGGFLNADNVGTLPAGGVEDCWGNLVIGATAADIVRAADDTYATNDIKLLGPCELITRNGKITLDAGGEGVLRDGKVIVFNGQVSLTEVNTYVDEDGNNNIEEVPSISVMPKGEFVFDVISKEISIPAGSQIIEERVDSETKGDVTIVTKDVTASTVDNNYDLGDQAYITVPADKVPEEGLVTNENGSISIPAGATVTGINGSNPIVLPDDANMFDNGTIIGGGSIIQITPSGDVVIPSVGGGSSSSNTSTSTTKNPDGSTTTTVTNKTTGTVTEVTKAKDGTTTTVETKKDGTVTETVKLPNGTTGTVVTDKKGNVTEVKATVTSTAVKAAEKAGEAVTLPVEVPAAKTSEDAPAVQVTVPKSAGSVKVEIPVKKVTPGTVAVIVKADGTEEIVKTSVITGDGVALKLDGSATVKIIDNTKNFADTNGHWAEDAIDFVTARELFAGTSATTFTPNSNVTRAQLMTVLARFDGEDTTGGSVWYEKGMEWAKANGVSDGSNPNGSITREQLATMLWRYSGSPIVEGTLDRFNDASEVSGYATDAMRWAVETGLIGGIGNNTLAPQGNATRAQLATILMRYCENLME